MDERYGKGYSRLYHHHWWWRAREAILLGEIRKLALPENAKILDFGCGNGLFLPELARYGEVWGMEIDTRLLDMSGAFRERILTEPLGSPRYETMQFDLIAALDVLEHIEDDARAVSHLARMLKPGGRLLVTVPALMSAWTEHDVLNQHYRRYSKRELRSLLAGGGKTPLLRYFFHFTYLPKLLVSLWERIRSGARAGRIPQDLIPRPPCNALLTWLSILEYRCLAPLGGLPFGTSLIAVIQKPIS